MPTPVSAHGLTMTQISRAIGLSRILLIIGLVFLHYGTFPNSAMTPFNGADPYEHSFATWVNSAVLFFFFSSVPLLSMISGWLFFSFPAQDARAALKKRIRRRFYSLYMPLVVWNIGYLGAIYLLYLKHPEMFSHSNRFNIDFSTANWLTYLNAITGITGVPIAFQFWFVRDLFVTVLVTPLFFLLLKRMPWAGAALIAVGWLAGFNFFIFTRPDVPFFFYLGALVREKELRMTVSGRTTVIALAIFVTLASLRALAPFSVHFTDEGAPYWLEVATRLMRIPGVIGCWGLIYRAAQTPFGARVGVYGGLAFFLHSAHWPMLAVVKIALWRFMPADSGGWMLLHYVASVGTTIFIGLFAGLMLARFLPRVFALMNGGRLLEQARDSIAPSAIAGPVPGSAMAADAARG